MGRKNLLLPTDKATGLILLPLYCCVGSTDLLTKTVVNLLYPNLLMAKTKFPTALITGASTGIGAVYADRLAKRGYDVILVARDEAKINDLASRLKQDYGVSAEPFRTDLTDDTDLAVLAKRVFEDTSIGLLVNNAGAATPGGFLGSDIQAIVQVLKLNINALTVLAHAAISRFASESGGTIINVASVLALRPEFPMGAYPATKSYVLTLSQSLQAEFGTNGIYIQAVLPGGTRTELWSRSDRDVSQNPHFMDVDTLVDAALVGFDRREPVTIPPLPDPDMWQAYEAARNAFASNVQHPHPGVRYLS